MGSTHGKEIDNTSATITVPASVEQKLKQRKMEYISPLHRSSAFGDTTVDPRSPGGFRRTPVHSPHSSTPPLSKAQMRERMLMRLGSASSSVDPRSPSSRRTPIATQTFAFEHLTPPPFSLGGSFDPRSPTMVRTPLYLSSTDDVDSSVIMDDVVVVEEKIHEGGEVLDSSKPAEASESKAEKVSVVVVESSGVTESTAARAFRESFSSSSETTISPALMALSISPLGSPALGYRKRKSVVDRYPSLSPLKKSYSAPMSDENTTTAALKRSAPTPSSKTRTPLSPLNNRAVNNRCMDVQPIKFRMDPGVLGL